MTLRRKAIICTLLVLLFHLLLALLLWAISFPLTHGPAAVGRTVLVLIGGPAEIAQNWCRLHLGITLLPMLAWDFLLAFLYLEAGLAAKRLKKAMLSGPTSGRRAFLAGGTAVLCTAVGIQKAYGEVQIVPRALKLKDLPHGLEGLKVALLADLHRGPVTSKRYLQTVIERVNSLEPDLVLLPGDFVSKSDFYFADITEILASLKPRIASLATLGNHDHWEGTAKAIAAVEKAGVILLTNRCVHLTQERTLTSEFPERGLCLAGVDDLWAGHPDLNKALAGVSANVPRLLMSHNPDFAEEPNALKPAHRVDLQLSGHTHGGQVVLPGVGPATSGSKYGLKYLYGEVQGPGWPVFVTRGIGTSIVPVRVGAPPEIVLFELQA